MTAKKALQVLIDNLEYSCDEEYDIVWNALNRLEELEKVLKIIKKHTNLNVANKGESNEQKCIVMVVLETQAEFDLLKEYLK